MTEEKARRMRKMATNLNKWAIGILVIQLLAVVFVCKSAIAAVISIILVVITFFLIVLLKTEIMNKVTLNNCFYRENVIYINDMLKNGTSKGTEILWKSILFVTYMTLGDYEEAGRIMTRLDSLYPVMSEERKAQYMINHLAYTKIVNPQNLKAEFATYSDFCSTMNQYKQVKKLTGTEKKWLLDLNQTYKYTELYLDSKWKETIAMIRTEPIMSAADYMQYTYKMAECYYQLKDYANAKQCYVYVSEHAGDTKYVALAKARLEELTAEVGTPSEPLLQGPMKRFQTYPVLIALVIVIVLFCYVIRL